MGSLTMTVNYDLDLKIDKYKGQNWEFSQS